MNFFKKTTKPAILWPASNLKFTRIPINVILLHRVEPFTKTNKHTELTEKQKYKEDSLCLSYIMTITVHKEHKGYGSKRWDRTRCG